MKFPFVKSILESELYNVKRERKMFDEDHPMANVCDRDILEIETVLRMIEKEEKGNE